jgi:hypothetical protein
MREHPIEEDNMRLSRSISAGILVLLCAGCEEEKVQPAPSVKPLLAPTAKKEVAASAAPVAGVSATPVRAFLDQKKETPAGLEWNHEVASRNGGAMSFRVDSQGPFSVTIITGQGYQALMSGGRKPLPSDVLLTTDSQGPTFEGKAQLPAGSSWFIIANRAKKAVEFRLQCFPGG